MNEPDIIKPAPVLSEAEQEARVDPCWGCPEPADVDRLRAEVERLRAENAGLRAQLGRCEFEAVAQAAGELPSSLLATRAEPSFGSRQEEPPCPSR